jgi:hypothetical protein
LVAADPVVVGSDAAGAVEALLLCILPGAAAVLLLFILPGATAVLLFCIVCPAEYSDEPGDFIFSLCANAVVATSRAAVAAINVFSIGLLLS